MVKRKEKTTVKKTSNKQLKDKKIKNKIKPTKEWENAPEYVEQDGVVYEKIFTDTEKIKIDLEPDVLEKIKERSRSGVYVNDQELVRELLRNLIATKQK